MDNADLPFHVYTTQEGCTFNGMQFKPVSWLQYTFSTGAEQSGNKYQYGGFRVQLVMFNLW
jgi:hypothetical protein